MSRTSDGSSPVSPEIGRLAIQSLGSWQWDMNAAASDPQTEILATVHRLKGLARRKHLAVMLTVPSGRLQLLLRKLFSVVNPHIESSNLNLVTLEEISLSPFWFMLSFNIPD